MANNRLTYRQREIVGQLHEEGEIRLADLASFDSERPGVAANSVRKLADRNLVTYGSGTTAKAWLAGDDVSEDRVKLTAEGRHVAERL